MLSFCLRGSSGCEDVLSEIAMVDKIFRILMEGPALKSLVSLVIIEGAVVIRSETSRVVLLWFRALYPGLTLEGFKDILDRELQRGEVAIHPVGSKWLC